MLPKAISGIRHFSIDKILFAISYRILINKLINKNSKIKTLEIFIKLWYIFYMIIQSKTNEVNCKNKKFNFWQYFKPHKCLIAAYIFLQVVFIAISVAMTLLGAQFIAKVTTGAYQTAIRILLIELVIYIANRLLEYVSNFIYYQLQFRLTKAMSFDIVEQSFGVASKAYSDHNTANFTQRIGNDPYTIFSACNTIINRVSSFVNSAIVVGYILVVSLPVGLVCLASALLGIVINIYRKNKVRKMQKENHRRNEKYSSLLNEVVRSERDIKSLNLEEKLVKQAKSTYNDDKLYSIKTNMFDYRWWTVQQFCGYFLNSVVLVLGIKFLDLGLLTLASFMIINSNRGYLNQLISGFEQIYTQYNNIGLAVERISELYEDDEYELEKFGTVSRKKLKGKIEFKNVGFTYIEYKQRDEKEIQLEKKSNKRQHIKAKVPTRVVVGKNKVFENLNFSIEPNTTVAFVGKSGSGKSTILNLISKMYMVDDGKITIDGININSLNKDTIRSSIALVNQFPYIFDMTIKENLLLAKPDATDAELEQVIKDSALDEFIATLSQGLNTRVGESGIKLSGGQKQRLAIARALLKKSSIILFDESTSSLDNLAQNHIKQSIDNIKGKSTIVIVAHRLSTIKNVDKIFFLDNGQIVDIGTFDELFKRNKAFETMFLAENI